VSEANRGIHSTRPSASLRTSLWRIQQTPTQPMDPSARSRCSLGRDDRAGAPSLARNDVGGLAGDEPVERRRRDRWIAWGVNPPAAAKCGRGRGSPAIGHSLVTVRHDGRRPSVAPGTGQSKNKKPRRGDRFSHRTVQARLVSEGRTTEAQNSQRGTQRASEVWRSVTDTLCVIASR
jgi:hypothetical protein